MNILILGAGGTGGYFGGRLVESGADVTFLVRPTREAVLRERGLRIESACGNANLQIQTTTSEAVHSTFDLIILSCKAYDLEAAIEAVRKKKRPPFEGWPFSKQNVFFI